MLVPPRFHRLCSFHHLSSSLVMSYYYFHYIPARLHHTPGSVIATWQHHWVMHDGWKLKPGVLSRWGSWWVASQGVKVWPQPLLTSRLMVRRYWWWHRMTWWVSCTSSWDQLSRSWLLSCVSGARREMVAAALAARDTVICFSECQKPWSPHDCLGANWHTVPLGCILMHLTIFHWQKVKIILQLTDSHCRK